MATTTATKTARTVVASTAQAGGATTRGTLNLATAMGALVTVKMANGATAPTTACKANILVAHSSTTPAAGSAGVDWKTFAVVTGSTTASTTTERAIELPASVMQACIEFTGNDTQPVTVESFASELTSIATS